MLDLRGREHPKRVTGVAVVLGSAATLLPYVTLDRLPGAPLALHMAGEGILLAGGALLAVVVGQGGGGARSGGWYPIAAVAVAVSLIAAWHVPALFGVAQARTVFHFLMHGSLLVAGFGLAAGLPALGPLTRALVLILGEGAMTIFALAMVTGALRYPGYPVGQNALAGIGMMLMMPLLWVTMLLAWHLRSNSPE